MMSSSFPKDPIQIEHLECNTVWEIYCIEWPPKVVFCTHCKVGLRLIGQDDASYRLAYRRII